MLRLLGSLRGLRVQLLLWTVLPLTLVLIGVTLAGITMHQQSMREMVAELDARSARLAAAHLSDGLTERATLLRLAAAGPELVSSETLATFFDAGLARLDAAGRVIEAFPAAGIWQSRPIKALLVGPDQPINSQGAYSSPFVDPGSGRYILFISLPLEEEGLIVGAVSLEQLGLTKTVGQARTAAGTALAGSRPVTVPEAGPPMFGATAFLVDSHGEIIYHPDTGLIGQAWPEYPGVPAVIQGESGATYHQTPGGQELVVGYAPIAGPGWGLIVQEPWEALIAPMMRLSLLTPLTVVAAALVSGLALTFGLRYVVHPLQALDRQATKVAWGDFSAVDRPVGGVQEIEDLRRTLAGMAGQIQSYQAGMHDYIAAVTRAQEEERQRLARELHDETIQSLIALGHRVEMVQKALDKDPDRARQRLAELSQLAAETQQEVRRFSRALRPLYLEDLGFVPALEMLAQETEQQTGVPVAVEVTGPVLRLAPDLELTAYRMAQEGLSNAIRHAQAQRVQLAVIFSDETLTLSVEDNGRGFNPPVNPAELAHQGHFGLMGLHERALLFGGRLEVRSRPGQGTALMITLPFRERS